jgi:hypothetical protein
MLSKASRHALLGGPFGSDKDLVVALLPLSTPSIPTATSSPHTMDDTHASAVGSLSGAQILGSTHRYEVAARVAVFTMSLRRFSDADAIIFAEEPIDPLILAVAERAKVYIIPYKTSDLPNHLLRSLHESSVLLHLFGTYLKVVIRCSHSA